MTAPPFSDLQPGFQRKTPISLPTWILSGDGIFQIEYSGCCCGFARWSSPGQATRTRRQPSLFHGLNTQKPVPGIYYRSITCNLHPLKGPLFSILRGPFFICPVIEWQNIACQTVPQANQSYYTDRFQRTPSIHSDTDVCFGFLKMDNLEFHIRWEQCKLSSSFKTSTDTLSGGIREFSHLWFDFCVLQDRFIRNIL